MKTGTELHFINGKEARFLSPGRRLPSELHHLAAPAEGPVRAFPEPLQTASCLPCVRVVCPKALQEYALSLLNTGQCLRKIPNFFVDIAYVLLRHRHAHMV